MLTFSNPRLRAEFQDWPLGGNKRGLCVFEVEHNPKKGYRVGRATTGKTKWHTFSGPAVIVDGSNGRTYVLQVACRIYGGTPINHGFIKISRSDFLDAQQEEIGCRAAVFARDNPELYRELLALIMAANPTAFTS